MFGGDMRKDKWFIEGGPLPKSEPLIDVEIRKATPDDLSKFSRIIPRKRLKKFEDWFRRGHEAFIALKDGKVVYYQWLAFSDFHHPWLSIDFKLKEDETFPIDIYTLPEYRMKNLHLSVNFLIRSYCRDKKRYRMVATASLDKFPLFKDMYKRSGFGNIYPMRSITYTRILGIKRHKTKELKGQD